MKGIVVEEGEKYFTFFKKIFEAINNIQRDYNWLMTDYECYPQNERYAEILNGEYCWMTGDEFTEMVEITDFQWIWGTFSAFPKSVPLEHVLQYEFPKAYECEKIWQLPVSIQHPLAEIEIIAWDSSATIFISRTDSIIDLLQKYYVLTKDLEKYIND